MRLASGDLLRTLYRALFRFLLGVLGLLAAVGYFASDLILTPAAAKAGLYAALAIAAAGFLVALSRHGPLFDLSQPGDAARFSAHKWMQIDVLRGVVVSLIAFGLGLGAAQQGAPWLYTQLVGEPRTKVFTVERWERAFRRDCARLVLAESGGLTPRHGLCVATPIEAGRSVRVTGLSSRLGIRAQQIEGDPPEPDGGSRGL
jgi:hypothetical protein